VVQPDALLRLKTGGSSQIDADGYVQGAPEFVAEVAPSSVSRDLHQKLELYQRAGVQEYLVWRVQDEAIDWFGLENGRYAAQSRDANGILRSRVMPGLWLDSTALVRGDLKAVLAVLEQGLASPEHAAFIA
jgi:Uma2 family endonuclease